MLQLFIKNNTSGRVHEYGSDPHDALILMEDGSLHYENMQCCAGTQFPEEGYSFCRHDGTVPNPNDIDIGDEYIDIGGTKEFAPVIHAYWKKEIEEDMYWYACSNCDNEVPKTRYRYDLFSSFCPHCGAQMDAPDPDEEAG